jgi:serine/threonine protein kinase
MPAIAELSVADWHRLNRLLETALGLEAEARTAWLRGLASTEFDLLPLLQQLLSPRDLTETAQFAVLLPARAWAEAPVTTEQAGQLIGPYRLERELGVGGMGTVWLAARADGAFERQVALKLPHAEWIDRGLAQRFARERAMLASLNHPNIAQLYDAGWSETGRPYLALEYVEGQPLPAWCAQQQLDTAARLRLFVDVIRAVAHAHARLIVHRDLKPSNVLVTAAGEVKLLDFGIAKLLADETASAAETELTRLAGRALTPSYAAPEQILGEPISTAADIYALGVLLFELLTGERPYRLSRADVQRRAALEEAIVHVDAPAPSSVVKDQARKRALRGDLDAIVLKALRKAPEQRYETAAAFADDIERYLNRMPVQAQRSSRAYRLRRFLARNRFAVGAVSAVIVALAVGLGVALWQATVARNEAARANTIKDFVLSIIQQADPRAAQASRVADLAMLKTIEQRIEKEFKGSAVERLQLRTAVARAYEQRGHHESARVLIRRALEEAEAANLSDDLAFLKARVLATSWLILDEPSVLDLDRVIERLRGYGPDGVEALVDGLIWRVGVAYRFERRTGMTWDTLYADGREAFDLAGRHLKPISGRQLHAAVHLAGHLLDETGNSRNLEDRSRESVGVLEAALANARADPDMEVGSLDLNLADAMYGYILCDLGRPQEAVRRMLDAMAVVRAHHTDDNYLIAMIQGLIYNCLYTLDEGDVAVSYLIHKYELDARRDTTQFVLAMGASDVASFMCAVQRTEQCVRWAEKAALHTSRMPPGEMQATHAAGVRPLQVRALIFSGETEQAEALALQWLRMPNCCDIADMRSLVSVAQLVNGKLDEALRSAEDGLTRSKGQPVREARMLVNRSAIELELGQSVKALATVESALPALANGDLRVQPIEASANLTYGRALLAVGRAPEAIEPLRKSYGYWLAHEPKSEWAAEAEYWFAQAYLANGDAKRGRWMEAEAKQKLAQSSFKPHRALAAQQTAPRR